MVLPNIPEVDSPALSINWARGLWHTEPHETGLPSFISVCTILHKSMITLKWDFFFSVPAIHIHIGRVRPLPIPAAPCSSLGEPLNATVLGHSHVEPYNKCLPPCLHCITLHFSGQIWRHFWNFAFYSVMNKIATHHVQHYVYMCCIIAPCCSTETQVPPNWRHIFNIFWHYYFVF